jgi:hypothetical protein
MRVPCGGRRTVGQAARKDFKFASYAENADRTDRSIESEAFRGSVEDCRDFLEPFVFEQRREVGDQEREFFLLILRVGERERCCPDGLRGVRVS